MKNQPSSFVDGEGFEQVPIRQVSERVGVIHQTLTRWAEKGLLPTGKAFHSFRSKEGRLFIRGDTVKELEERFRSVPEGKPAGKITIGITTDASGFVPINKARQSIPGLARWISHGKLADLVKQSSVGEEVAGLHLELVEDPLHHNKRYASERSLRALMSPEAQAKFYSRTGKPSPLNNRPK